MDVFWSNELQEVSTRGDDCSLTCALLLVGSECLEDIPLETHLMPERNPDPCIILPEPSVPPFPARAFHRLVNQVVQEALNPLRTDLSLGLRLLLSVVERYSCISPDVAFQELTNLLQTRRDSCLCPRRPHILKFHLCHPPCFNALTTRSAQTCESLRISHS